MRFVFDNDPSTVQKRLSEFSDELGRLYRPQPLKFNIYETEFYSQVDGSLDFGRTRYVKETICSIDSIEFKPLSEQAISSTSCLFQLLLPNCL